MKFKTMLVKEFAYCGDCDWEGDVIMMDYTNNWNTSIDDFIQKTDSTEYDSLKIFNKVDFFHIVVTTVSGELLHFSPIFNVGRVNKTVSEMVYE